MTEAIIGGISVSLLIFFLGPRMSMGSTMVGKGLFKEIDLKWMARFYMELAYNDMDGSKITFPAFLCQFIGDVLGLIHIILVLVLGLNTTDVHRMILICGIYCGIGLCITFSFTIYIEIEGRRREKKLKEEQNKSENKKNRW